MCFLHHQLVSLFFPAEVSMVHTRLMTTIISLVEEIVGGARRLKVAGVCRDH